MDFATTAPSTAAAMLSAHTIIVLTKASQEKETHDQKAPERNTDETAQKDVEMASEETSEHLSGKLSVVEATKETDATSHEESGKSKKWQKILNHSFQLAELCFNSKHPELEDYAMIFLLTVSRYFDTLEALPLSRLFTSVWKVLSNSDNLAGNSDSLLHFQLSLKPLLSFASPEDYEKLLQDLLKQTQTRDSNLTHTMMLWQLVIASKVYGVNGSKKRAALERLIPMLVNLVDTLGTSTEGTCPLLMPLIETLKELIDSDIGFTNHARATVLAPCSIVPLQNLPVDQFHQVSYA